MVPIWNVNSIVLHYPYQHQAILIGSFRGILENIKSLFLKHGKVRVDQNQLHKVTPTS